MEVKQLMAIASTTLFVVALIVNITFIYIVYNNGRKSIGTYKYLLASFSLCNILYSSFEYASKPAVHIYGTSCIIYNNGLYEDSPKWGTVMLCCFYSMYGMGTALLALHFLYRYFIVCRPERSTYFELPCIALWIIPMLLWGLLYAFLAYYSSGPTEEIYNYAEESVRNTLHRELRKMAFFCMFTHKVEDGEVTIYWRASVGLALSTVMLIFTFGLMVICGMKIMRTLREMVMSKKAVALQKQLLAALIVQVLNKVY
ncbi:unnamed protein product [Cylicocyclus nassatus]|uniref:Uncharacterized protein n=1 Tax=Cylicocyclus nassatus TaxID=53992 RepID=A0AA36DIS3_CYLNA|nr:unnamed protein product [Cylicocyclus nassatus]